MGEENGVGRVHGEDPGREDKSEECRVGHCHRPVKQDGKKGGNLKLEWSKRALNAPKL